MTANVQKGLQKIEEKIFQSLKLNEEQNEYPPVIHQGPGFLLNNLLDNTARNNLIEKREKEDSWQLKVLGS